MNNLRISEIFSQIADLLELKGENIFRIRSYRKAALNIQNLPEDISDIAKRNEIRNISGIGQDLEQKILEFIKTGEIELHNKLLKDTPKIALELMSIQGIGPKKAKLISEKLKIKSIGELEEKAKKGSIAALPGFKDKSVQNILRSINFFKKANLRTNLVNAYTIANGLVKKISTLKDAEKVVIAGSTRRMKETVKDIDILVTSNKPDKIMNYFVSGDFVKSVLAKGHTKSSVILKDGIEADLRVVDKKSFGAALCYFTGSKAHNIRLREIAISKGLKLNEYGLFKKNKFISGKNEEEIYKCLGLQYIPCELREDSGEIEAAKDYNIPNLIQAKDILGDLHVHSKYSDGVMSIEDIAKYCLIKGYQYVASTDHSKSLMIANGLDEKTLSKKFKEIDRVNSKIKGITILKSAEVDILSDGRIDYPDAILKEFDIVTAAIHTGFKQSKEMLTKRILKAMDNKYVNIIAHLSGRLIGIREAYELDIKKIIEGAHNTNTALEINGFPDRLDIDDVTSRAAKNKGVKMALSTDAHTKEQLNNMFFSLSVARRGWLEPKDVINTLPLKTLLQKIKK